MSAPIEPIDDASILDEDRLLRRIPPNQLCMEDGKLRPSSAVFRHAELSVYIESMVVAQGRAAEDVLSNYPNEFLTALPVSEVRKFPYPIVKDNEPPHDPAHGLVVGKKTGGFANAMKRCHLWVVPPPGS